MQSTPSIAITPGSLRTRVVELDGVLLMGSNKTVWHLNWVQTNNLYKIEIFEIELFDYSTVSKQIYI